MSDSPPVAVSLSLNEVESLCAKAVHGAGYPWGVAADVAKAVRWLAERDLSGLASLLRTLRDKDAVVIAASFADGASALTETPLELEEFCAPLLLVPFLAWASVLTRENLEAQFAEVLLCFVNQQEINDPLTAMQIYGDPTRLPAQSKVSVRLVSKPASALTLWGGRASRLEVAGENLKTLAQLEALAHHTYAPATEESRRSGAGSALSDND